MSSRPTLLVLAALVLLSAVLLPTFSRRFLRTANHGTVNSALPLPAEMIASDDATAEDTSSHLESDSEVQRAFVLREKLEKNPNDATTQMEYMNLVGEVEWASPEEEAIFTGTRSGLDDDESSFVESASEYDLEAAIPVMGPLSSVGEEGSLHFREAALIDSKNKKHQASRLIMNRRDYTVETRDHNGYGTHPKYVFDGETWSLHQRMYLLKAGEDKPRYVVRRAYNYWNPLARTFGQFTYRIVPYQHEQGRHAKYKPSDSIFTITQDRIGRGALWLREEWRVYRGDGGCRKSFGMFGCNRKTQVYYGVSDATGYSTTFYDGTTEKNPKSPQLELARLQRTGGVPRALAWPTFFLGPMQSFLPWIGLATYLWADKYHLHFNKPVDEMLVSSLVAVQDVTRDLRRGMTGIGAR